MTKNHVEIFIACFSLYTLFIFVIGIYEFVCLSNKKKKSNKNHTYFIYKHLSWICLCYFYGSYRQKKFYVSNEQKIKIIKKKKTCYIYLLSIIFIFVSKVHQ